MEINSTLLKKNIEDELAYKDFVFCDSDKIIAQEMIQEINTLGYNFKYIAEIEAYEIPGSGKIISKYINQFSSETTRAYLLYHLVADKIEKCAEYIFQLYLHFKSSDEYISQKNQPASAHIYVRYDNAFKILKPKRLKEELLRLVHNPRDAFYLPLTMRMLSSWKISEIKELLIIYLEGSEITLENVGLGDNEDGFYPNLNSIRRELKFTALEGLKYFPSVDIMELVKPYAINEDPDIKVAAKKTLKVIENKMKKVQKI